MAGHDLNAQQPSYRNIVDLEKYFLDDVQRTEMKFGCGTFGAVQGLTVGGTAYVGKMIHASLIEKDNIDEVSRLYKSTCELLSESRLRHSNIVMLMGLCIFDESIYPVLVMEKVDESLQSIITTYRSVFPLPLILHVLKDVTKGLMYMHNQTPPIIHRNLTAKNILINRTTMIAKIADIVDALIADPDIFLNTLLRSQPILPYMPPEVLYNKPNHTCMLDIFSFGHLVLASTIQQFPLAKDLQPSTYIDEKTGETKARSEVERREIFIKMLYKKLTEKHKLSQMVLQCLHDMPGRRPTALKVMELIADIFVDEDPYGGDVDLVKLLNMTDQQAFDISTGVIAVGSEDFLKHRVTEIKNGAPVVLDIFRFHGRFKRKQDWRRQMFQIKDGFLKYFKSNPVDESHDKLDLSLVVCVNACPPRDNNSRFYFQIHYAEGKGSPWLLRAYTQDDRACWMEAIRPGSSAFFRSPESNPYEKVSFDAIYDEPEIAVAQYHRSKGNHHPVYESNKKSTSVPSKGPSHASLPPEMLMSKEKSGLHMHPKEKIPADIGNSKEIKENQISNLDPNEVQLLMLLQMQKMVQKMENVYEANRRTKHLQKGAILSDRCFLQPPDVEQSQVDHTDISKTSTDRDTTYLKDTSTTRGYQNLCPASFPHHIHKTPPSEGVITRKRTRSEPCSQCKPGLSSLSKSKTFSRSCDNVGSSLLTVSPLSTTGIHIMSAHQRRPHKMSHRDIISALNKTVSPKITSHLVVDDVIYESGRRPEWTKAKTQSSGVESLDDLHQNALWIPRSALQNLEELGQGQYGKVYKGEYRRLDRPKYFVAIKTIRQHESEKEKEQFLTEMRVMSNMIHPNIVRLFGLVQQDQPWIILEYLPHGDLKTFLTKKRQPLNKIIKYMLDVATGMHYISERGLIHRDLAARNIMVNHDEICKVGDFGLLRKIPKDADVYIAKSEFALPIRWMAPESYTKKEFSPATDVWSFGVVMWEMYNPTKSPYEDMDNMECIIKVSQGTRLSIPELYPEIVRKIMKACWQMDASKRPSFMLCAALLTNVYLTLQQDWLL